MRGPAVASGKPPSKGSQRCAPQARDENPEAAQMTNRTPRNPRQAQRQAPVDNCESACDQPEADAIDAFVQREGPFETDDGVPDLCWEPPS
jgi:hypothetical protein